ncbi:unnamed protein product, partial [Didymodactylos carnosus]
YKGRKFEILVTTHTTKLYSINDFGKGEGTRCPVDYLERHDENNKLQELSRYRPANIKGGCSKGFLVIAFLGRELGLKNVDKLELNALKEKMSSHLAFRRVISDSSELVFSSLR